MRLTAIATMLALAPWPAAAGGVALLAEACTNCHGAGGAGAGAMPALAGRPAEEIAASLTAFRDGTAPATIMTRFVKPLTDAEIRELAAAVAALH